MKEVGGIDKKQQEMKQYYSACKRKIKNPNLSFKDAFDEIRRYKCYFSMQTTIKLYYKLFFYKAV